MRFIKKGSEPATLRKFKAENKQTPEVLTYSALRADIRNDLYACMLAEQWKLCAYTMMPIGRQPDAARRDFHVEHIQPRSGYPERELDYDNLVLCSPGPQHPEPGFGARQKGDADVSDANFVSPLNASCESRLRFGINGAVRPEKPDDAAVIRTIDLLALNHPSLIDGRSQALKAQGLGPSARKPISATEARRLTAAIMMADPKGEIAAFCVAVKQVAEHFARQSQARSARVKGAAGG
ncbi:retron system putative HNH endonuclease [Roseiarcus sp.]|uniref:retron system putative HNH endonuclease n=1 Tax=Roseiarcus sp. TaxID=1969460 RepID=UPI003F9738F1